MRDEQAPDPAANGQPAGVSRPPWPAAGENAGHQFHWLRYVPHARAEAFEAQGWENRGPAPGHFAVWSVVMRWPHPHDPPEAPR